MKKSQAPGEVKLQTVYVEINKLKPSEYNPRKWDPDEEAGLEDSIREFGNVTAILVNSAKNRLNIVIGGHMRLHVAKAMGHKTIPVNYINIPDIAAEKKLNLRLNANHGHFDIPMLAQFDPAVLHEIGFPSQTIDKLFQKDKQEDDYNAQEEHDNIKETKVKPGDLYRLGRHRLLCGDSLNQEHIARLMDGKKADLIFTDPPYNVAYQGRKFDQIKNDDMSEAKFITFCEQFVASMKSACRPGTVYYICSGYSSFPTFLWALRANGFEFSTPIIWVKNQFGLGWGDYHHKHEMIIKTTQPPAKKRKAQPILYGWNQGKHFFVESRAEADVWEIKKRAGNNMVHPTQKPIELVSRAITNSSKIDDIVLDLFGGSGSTLIAAEKNKRIAYINELDPKYVECILNRWTAYTGNQPEKVK